MKSDAKQMIVLGVSFLVGVLAFVLTRIYIQKEWDKVEAFRQEIERQTEKIQVLVADHPLSAGTTLTASDLGKKLVAKNIFKGMAVEPEDFTQIEGKKLLRPLERLNPLLWDFVDVPYRPGSGLAPMIRKRMRALSLSVSGSAAVSGLIQPNDRVDVLGTFSFPSKTNKEEMTMVTMTILQNVTVIATGTQIGKSTTGMQRGAAGGPKGYSTVTLEVTPKEAELLVFSELMKGRLTLVLRNPDDMDSLSQTELESVDFNDLHKNIQKYNEIRQNTIIPKRVR